MLPCEVTSPDTPAAVKAEEENGSSHRILQSSLMRSLYRRRMARYYAGAVNYKATSREAGDWRKFFARHVVSPPREWQTPSPAQRKDHKKFLRDAGRVIEEVRGGFKC